MTKGIHFNKIRVNLEHITRSYDNLIPIYTGTMRISYKDLEVFKHQWKKMAPDYNGCFYSKSGRFRADNNTEAFKFLSDPVNFTYIMQAVTGWCLLVDGTLTPGRWVYEAHITNITSNYTINSVQNYKKHQRSIYGLPITQQKIKPYLQSNAANVTCSNKEELKQLLGIK